MEGSIVSCEQVCVSCLIVGVCLGFWAARKRHEGTALHLWKLPRNKRIEVLQSVGMAWQNTVEGELYLMNVNGNMRLVLVPKGAYAKTDYVPKKFIMRKANGRLEMQVN